MLLETEERGVCHGIELAPEIKLTPGGVIGFCACGGIVRVAEPEDEGDDNDLTCPGCNASWRLSVVLVVERA